MSPWSLAPVDASEYPERSVQNDAVRALIREVASAELGARGGARRVDDDDDDGRGDDVDDDGVVDDDGRGGRSRR